MSKNKMQLIDDLVSNADFCVLATTNGIEPLCSLMTLFADHASMKFYFLTNKDSQKSKNIKQHPHASILIDRREENIALTVQGVYSPIKTRQTTKAIMKLFLHKHPELKDFVDQESTELIRIVGKRGKLLTGIDDIFETKF
tara:strand:- start:214 stop:636 length:423 start_codon:yes stop_codon:yes gene_type:complete